MSFVLIVHLLQEKIQKRLEKCKSKSALFSRRELGQTSSRENNQDNVQ